MAPKGKGKAKAAPAPAAAFSAVPTLDEACALLLKNEPAPFREATETLFTILNNITAKPDEAAFRRLKRANAALSASSAVPTLDEACALLLKNEPAPFREATETLFTILNNITAKPDEAVFRRLKRANAALSAKVFGAKGGVRFLRAVGFVEEGAGDEAAFVLPAAVGAEQIAAGKAALKAAVKQFSLSAEKVFGAKGGVRFLRAVGFVEEGAGDEAAFVLPAAVGAEQLAAGKAALKAAVKQFSHVQEALRTAENEAAAQKLRDLRDLSKQNNSKRDAATAGEKDAIKAEIAAERFEWERQRDPTNFK